MARTSVTTQKITRAGLAAAATAPAGLGAANGDVVDSGNTALEVICGATGTTVTVEVPVMIDGLTVGPLVVVCPANTTTKIGPFTGTFKQTAASVAANAPNNSAVPTADVGRVYVDYSVSIATVTRSAVSF